jgi:hypothetical protein
MLRKIREAYQKLLASNFYRQVLEFFGVAQ